MQSKLHQIVKLMLLCLLMLFLGFKIGNKYAVHKLDKYYGTLLYNTTGSELNINVALAQYLKNSEIDKANKILEYLIDADLLALSPYDTMPAEERNQDVLKAIKSAKLYREKYPDHKVDNKLSGSIQRVFNLVK